MLILIYSDLGSSKASWMRLSYRNFTEQFKYVLDVTKEHFLNSFSIQYFTSVQALVTLALADPVTLQEDH